MDGSRKEGETEGQLPWTGWLRTGHGWKRAPNCGGQDTASDQACERENTAQFVSVRTDPQRPENRDWITRPKPTALPSTSGPVSGPSAAQLDNTALRPKMMKRIADEPQFKWRGPRARGRMTKNQKVKGTPHHEINERARDDIVRKKVVGAGDGQKCPEIGDAAHGGIWKPPSKRGGEMAPTKGGSQRRTCLRKGAGMPLPIVPGNWSPSETISCSVWQLVPPGARRGE